MNIPLALQLFLPLAISSVDCYQLRPFLGSFRPQPRPAPRASAPPAMTTSFAPVPRGHAGVKDRSAHVDILDRSLRDLTGRGVYERMGMGGSSDGGGGGDPCCCEVCLNQRYALISHDAHDEPLYNYGNSAMMTLLGCTWDELCHLPTRRLSEGEELVGRDLMERGGGYVDGATNIWVTHDGKPFTVHDMLIWNCYDESGKYYGQAAMFDRNSIDRDEKLES